MVCCVQLSYVGPCQLTVLSIVTHKSFSYKDMVREEVLNRFVEKEIEKKKKKQNKN